MRKVIISLVFLLVVQLVNAQERSFNRFSFGFQLVQFQDDFGVGVHLLTPAYKNLRINVKTNLNWLQHIDKEGNHTWTEYLNNQVGINFNGRITSNINLYSEGGVVLLYPNALFSDETVNFGGYGLFGFEFFFSEKANRNASYFIELGGMGGAVANRLPSNPIHANGFLIAVGYRF